MLCYYHFMLSNISLTFRKLTSFFFLFFLIFFLLTIFEWNIRKKKYYFWAFFFLSSGSSRNQTWSKDFSWMVLLCNTMSKSNKRLRDFIIIFINNYSLFINPEHLFTVGHRPSLLGKWDKIRCFASPTIQIT